MQYIPESAVYELLDSIMHICVEYKLGDGVNDMLAVAMLSAITEIEETVTNKGLNT